ncbi:single-pass membrane and coiled-coil domain-containing protein 1 isoform X1 [Rhinolophus ferrumequinum]|uniref:single-pass membrane and coiled-coil domain-containing protein 1 isoform X1 n=1 Tax=Rhinolophus ferrumequinum TaxID=59479 RepID=UPI00140FA37F|nr:single-pass membrane and coiled-coil domain-containing protein 1 isoform X1 [Rhinolophus ferrumequinum]
MNQSPSGRVIYNPGNVTYEQFSLDLSFPVHRPRKTVIHTAHVFCIVDHKLKALEAQFKELDFTKDNLTQKFEHHTKTLASQAAQDELWTAVLALKFTSMELNILYSYVVEVLICLHTHVLEKLPDLVRGLPTLSSVLRRKVKNKRIRDVWESVLEECGLQEGDITALCTFFIAHGSKSEHYSANVRQMYIRDVPFMITNMVKNQALRDGLLRAIQVIEKGKAVRAPEEQKSSLKELIPSVKN